ncbi:MAG TPA: SCO family protein [Woeseiaceae bacterium]|nr:SCO family protein [Woeseiaceae bacterium]
MSFKNLIIAVVLGVALAAGLFLSLHRTPIPAQLSGATLLPAPVLLPTFNLQDQNGQAVTGDIFKGQWDLVFFGFTNCPDICPLSLQTLSRARQQMAEAGHDELPRIVFVSVDPERDSAPQLARYMSAFGTDNLGLTGDIAELRKLTEALGIYFNKSGDGENYSVDHSSVVIVIGPDGRYRALFSAPHTPDVIVHDLSILMAA